MGRVTVETAESSGLSVELLGILVKAVPCHAVCMGCSLYCHKSLMCGKVTMWLTEAERLPVVLVVVLKEKL